MKIFLLVLLVSQAHGLLERPRRVQQMDSFEVVDDDAMQEEERKYQDDASIFEVSNFEMVYDMKRNNP